MRNVRKACMRALQGAAMAGVVTMLTLGSLPTAMAATGTVGVHRAKLVSCNSTMNMAAPKVYAVNSTTGVDSQMVVFQALLFKWDGSAWVLSNRGPALEGKATDTSSPGTWLDYKIGYVVGQGTQSFPVTHGYYKVAINYWWLRNDGTTSGHDYAWAPTYVTQIGAVAPYCHY